MKRFALIIALLIFLSVFLTSCGGDPMGSAGFATPNKSEIYKKATKALEENWAVVAYSLFSRLGEYKDSQSKAQSLRYVLYYRPFGSDYEMYVTNEGKVKYSKNIGYQSFYKHLDNWNGISALCGGSGITNLGIKSDGTVNSFSQQGAYEGIHVNFEELLTNVASWTDVIQIETSGISSFFGLKKDGTILLAYPDRYDYLKSWHNISQLATINWSELIGLKSDGTLALSSQTAERYYNISNLRGIIMINDDFALKSDGTVAYLKYTKTGQNDPFVIPSNWKDIVALFPGLVMNSEGVLIDKKGTEYRTDRHVVYAFEYRPGVVVGIKDNGETFVLDNRTDQNYAEIIEQYKTFIGNVNDIVLPKDIFTNKFLDVESAAKRFDQTNRKNIIVFTYPMLEGKYRLMTDMIGTDELGYLNNDYGLTDSSGNVIFENRWTDVTPITDDRFILVSFVSGDNPMDPDSYNCIIADRTGKMISPERFNGVSFSFENTKYETGIAKIFRIGLPQNDNARYILVDTDGKRISSDRWDSLEYTRDGKIRAVRGANIYILDLNGKIISEINSNK